MNIKTNQPDQTVQPTPPAQTVVETTPVSQSITGTPSPSKKKPLIIVLAGLFFTALITLSLIAFCFLKIRQPAAPKWNGLQPGVSSKEDVISKLGQPNKIEELPFSTALVYPSDYEVFPNVIVLNEEEKINQFLFRYH